MIASLALIALSQEKVLPQSQWPPQWRDPYEVRIGGARLGMTEKEFIKLVEAERSKNPKKEPLLAKMQTEFKEGRLTTMWTDQKHPNSNIPMPGTKMVELIKMVADLGIYSRGIIGTGIGNVNRFGSNGVAFIGNPEEVFIVTINDNALIHWGIVTRYEADKKQRDPKNWIMSGNYYVKNHRPVSVDIDLVLARFEDTTNTANPYHLKAETLTNVKPGETRKVPFTYPAIDYTNENAKFYDFHFEIEKITERK